MLPCPTGPTLVAHESDSRAPRVRHPSKCKIATFRLGYINCLFILAFEIFSNTSFYFVLSSVCLGTSAMNRSPTPTECMLQLFMYTQCLFHEHVTFTHVHQRLHPRAPTVGADLSCPHSRNIHCGLSTHTYIILVHLARILRNTQCGYFFVSFVLFFICAIVYLCALMIFFFRSVAPTHVATTLN